MKKILLFKTFMLLAVLGANAQPMQESFTNPFGYSSDHYSIETAPETAPYSYACAGTFFNGTQTIMHIFTLDDFGGIVWENIVNLGGTDCRALDVAIGKNSNVAITGFIDSGSGTDLYAALYDQTVGTLIFDYQYTGTNNTSGSNIIYSTVNDHYIIGGFESIGANGNALLIALDGGFNQQWATIYDATCDGFNMSTINEIVEIKTEYFITGNISNADFPDLTGKSQVLAAIVRSSDGSILDNESFRPTSAIGQEAMGVSAHFNSDNEELLLLYNVSNSTTVDENRPYIARYRLLGLDLTFDSGYRIDDTFSTNPSSFVSNPSFTGLKILPNDNDGTYLIFGMLEAYGGGDDRVLSVYQEIKIPGGAVVAPAKFWTQSDIPTGFPNQGGDYSLFNDVTLNTDLYTPESTTLNIDLNNFVSILPTPGGGVGDYKYDIISSSLNTANANSGCIEDFEMELVGHEIYASVCLDVNSTAGTVTNPFYSPTAYSSSQSTTCIINMSPALEISETEMVNELTLYANPTHDILRFSVSEKGTYDVFIMNTEGRVLYKEEWNNMGSQNQIKIENLATGIYILTVINQDGQSNKKKFVRE